MRNISKSVLAIILIITTVRVSCVPVQIPDLENNKVQVDEVPSLLLIPIINSNATESTSTFETVMPQPTPQNQSSHLQTNASAPVIQRKNYDVYDDSDSAGYYNIVHQEQPTEKPSIATVQKSVNIFFDTLRSSVRDLLINGNRGILRAIGTADRTHTLAQKGLQNSSFTLVLEGQKVAAKLYDQTPTQVNKFIQRIGTVRNSRFYQQINEVVNMWRDNNKKWEDAWIEHEYDWHDRFQKYWPEINKHLGVQELPRMPVFGWF